MKITEIALIGLILSVTALIALAVVGCEGILRAKAHCAITGGKSHLVVPFPVFGGSGRLTINLTPVRTEKTYRCENGEVVWR